MPKVIQNKETIPPTRINQIMKEKNISLNDIVENTTITQSALSMLLNGKRKISLLQIIEIADYLNCSIDYLLYRSKMNTF